MKILLSAYACEPDRGSEPVNGWNWARALAEQGHHVHLLTRPTGKAAIDLALHRDAISGLDVTYFDVPSWKCGYLKGQIGVFAHYLAWQRAVLGVARELGSNVDVVHHVTWGSIRGSSALWKLDRPFVLGPLGGGQVAPSAFRQYWENGWYLESIRAMTMKHVLKWHPATTSLFRNTDLALATNEETLGLCRAFGAKRTGLFLDTGLPVGYLPDEIPHRKAGERLRVLWVGRVYFLKGLTLALDALAKTRIPFELTIIGDGPAGSRIPSWIGDRGLDSKVVWRGMLAPSEVRSAYAEHDVLLFPTLRDSFGTQFLEAMAFGLPIVALNHHGARTFIPESAAIKVPVTTPTDTSSALAEGLERLWHHPEVRREMGNQGFAFAQMQSWPKRAEAMTKLYESVL